MNAHQPKLKHRRIPLRVLSILLGTLSILAAPSSAAIGTGSACACNLPPVLSFDPSPIEFAGAQKTEAQTVTVNETGGTGTVANNGIKVNPEAKGTEGYLWKQGGGTCNNTFIFGPNKRSCTLTVELINHVVGNKPTAKLEIQLMEVTDPFTDNIQIK